MSAIEVSSTTRPAAEAAAVQLFPPGLFDPPPTLPSLFELSRPPPAKSRCLARQNEGSIVVRSRRASLLLMVLPLAPALLGAFSCWVGWSAAGPGELYPPTAGALAGLFLFYLAVRLFASLFGEYEIELSRRDLKLRYALFGFSRSWVYDLARVRRLRIENVPPARIAFDFGPATVRFGDSLGQPASAEMLRELRRLFIELAANSIAAPLAAGPHERRVEPPAPLHRFCSTEDRLLISLPAQHPTRSAVIAVIGMASMAFAAFLLLAKGSFFGLLPAAPAIFFALELAWYEWGYEEIEVRGEMLCHRACLLGYVKNRCFALADIASLCSGAKIPISTRRGETWLLPFFFGDQLGTLHCRVSGRTEMMLIQLEEGETEMVVAEIKTWLEQHGLRLGAGDPPAGAF